MGYIDKIQDRNGTISDIHDTGAREAIELLQQAIAGKVGFDGVLSIDYSDAESSYVLDDASAALLSSHFPKATFYKLYGIYGGYAYHPRSTNLLIVLREWQDFKEHISLWKFTYNTTTKKCEKASYNLLGQYDNIPQDWDTTPTENSTKPVTSGGVYAALAAIVPGTKLYQHQFVINFTYEGTDFSNIELSIISTVNNSDNNLGSLVEVLTKNLSSNILIPYQGNTYRRNVVAFDIAGPTSSPSGVTICCAGYTNYIVNVSRTGLVSHSVTAL